MNKPLKFLTYAAAFLALNTLCKHLTDDFSLDYLLKPSPKDSKWTVENNEPPLSSLDQKYFYLGKGKQAHVFESEDGKHVLKLLKPPSPRVPLHFFGKTVYIGISKLPFAKEVFKRVSAEREKEQRELDFQSYLNSFTLLKNETELEYLHLKETDSLNLTLRIYDKIGILRQIELDSTCFILQKKTEMLYPSLEALIKKGQKEDAKKIIDGYVHLSLQFLEKGIVNPTTIEKNFGCIDLKPVQIDVGRVLREKDLELPSPVSLEDVYRCTHHLKKWLIKKSPDLVPYLEKSTERQKRESYEKTV